MGKYLNKTGLSYLWLKMRSAFAPISHTHTKSEITDLSGDGIPFIMGTQTATTASWTGEASFLATPADLVSGTSILYYLPRTSAANATLNLTCANGAQTGAKNLYYDGSKRLTTHYTAGNVIRLTYLENVSINGSGSYTGWWAEANYDTNNYDRLRYQQAIKAGDTAIVAANIIVPKAETDGTFTYTHLKLGRAFDTRYPILYSTAALAVGATGTNNYLMYPLTITTTQAASSAATSWGMDITAQKAVYIKGTINGTTFTPISTTPLRLEISDDGYQYMLLGVTYSTTAMYLLPYHNVYEYKNSNIREWQPIISASDVGAATAQHTHLLDDITDFEDACVTGVKGDAESSYRKGEVNITKADIGLGNVLNETQVTLDTEQIITALKLFTAVCGTLLFFHTPDLMLYHPQRIIRLDSKGWYKVGEMGSNCTGGLLFVGRPSDSQRKENYIFAISDSSTGGTSCITQISGSNYSSERVIGNVAIRLNDNTSATEIFIYYNGVDANLVYVSGINIITQEPTKTLTTGFAKVTQPVVGVATTETIYSNGTALSSDERLKENIEPIDINKVKGLIDNIRTVEFNFKEGNERRQIGVIAQDVVKYFPQAVYGDLESGDFLSVDYSKLVVPLIACVRDLRKEVAELKVEIENIKK